jgi:glucose/arabinose dehydrogenase
MLGDMIRRAALAIASTALLVACGSQGGGAAPASGPAPRYGTVSRTTSATAAATGVRLLAVGRFDQPVYVTAPRGQHRRVFVVEQPGVIRVIRGGRVLARPFLDIRSRVTNGGEQGLLGLAFAPDYRASGRFYVYFTGRDQRQWVVEYRRATADRANPASARTLMRMVDPEPNHNGGAMNFGPDGLLYIGTGDGGGANDQHGARGNGQNLNSLLGKLLRIDPKPSGGRSYTIPRGNPFFSMKGHRGEIWDYGLRNPWRWSFDRRTGDLTIGDVGQDQVEEINFRPAGRTGAVNFGWRPLEGDRRNFDEVANGALSPVLTHSHSDGWCSITGGYVVRDPRLPALDGRYVYGDFCRGVINVATLRPGGASGDRALGVARVEQLASFGEDGLRRVYAVSHAGPVYRLVPR